MSASTLNDGDVRTKSGRESLLLDDALHDAGFDGVLCAICDEALEILTDDLLLRGLDFQS